MKLTGWGGGGSSAPPAHRDSEFNYKARGNDCRGGPGGLHRDLVKGIPLAPAEHGAVALQMGWEWGIRAKRRPHA